VGPEACPFTGHGEDRFHGLRGLRDSGAAPGAAGG
jgi:hypothetical protein